MVEEASAPEHGSEDLRLILRRLLAIARSIALLIVPLLLWQASVERSVARDVQALVRAPAERREALLAHLDSLRPVSVPLLIRAFGVQQPTGGDGRARRRATLQHPPLAIPVLYALADLGGPDVIAALIAALGDEHPDVRHYAAMTLAYIGEPATPSIVEALTRAPDVRRRVSAAWILSLMGEPGVAALPALEVALRDESREVRYTARYAIHQLSAGNEGFWRVVEQARSERPPARSMEEPR
jgi:hypothetical protein